MPTRILLLDNAIYRDVYRPLDHWRTAIDAAWPEPVKIVAARQGEPPPSPVGFTHVIVSGSEASIMDDDPWVAPQLALLREAADLGVAILGSCHGHQMVARAFGGRAGQAAIPELGWIELPHDDDPMFAGADEPLWVFASHFDEVVELPAGFVATARTERCGIHAFRHRERRIWGVQAHPEIDPPTGQMLLDAFCEVDPRAAAAHHDLPARDSGWISPLLRAFLAAAP
jgi:GMP synthase-like glutamine amidotransferase